MKIYLYAHGGSENHGCEGIVRSTAQMLSDFDLNLISLKPEEDIKYGLDRIVKIINGVPKVDQSFNMLWRRLYNKILDGSYLIYQYMYQNYFEDKEKSLCFSIGGDNYCYGTSDWLKYLNKKANCKKHKTVLWGCSVDPNILKDKEVIDDLKKYSLITVRETLSYEALQKAGLINNIRLYPDPAFILPSVKIKLPKGFIEGNTVGINVSPLINKYANVKDAVMSNFYSLIQYIIKMTNMQIALIPHVVKSSTDDRKPLCELYDNFKNTGRVVLIEDHNCMELKGYISKCRIFIGARTHSTIAAYSTCVPTLVVGYSVKAKGIAKDIFGTYESYVKPVQSLQNNNDLIKSFEWIYDHENDIRTHLKNIMPSYIKRTWEARDEVRKLVEVNCQD